jgi:plastocyanin
MKVPADALRSVLGISSVTQHKRKSPFAIVDDTLPKATPTSNTSAAAPNVSIGNFTFKPQSLQVAAGTTVSWVNEDDVPHTIVGSDPGSPLKSGALDTDASYSAVLDKPGTYPYFCSLHPHMTGTVVVT